MHVDYDVNAQWVRDLSRQDYRDDVLILAGDITHKLPELAACLSAFVMRFKQVLFVPGNHDVWVRGDDRPKNSLQKFAEVAATVEAVGASMQPFVSGETLFAPLLGWYDYSFGEPSDDLKQIWMDFHACRWPEGFGAAEVASHFLALNHRLTPGRAARVITFSHFLPRLDLVPSFVSRQHRILNPVLGSTRLDEQLRKLNSTMHVYGHSHINRRVIIDGVTYINNAFGYPGESGISARQLLCIDEI
jgi:UDP-2,3-diacylglucosamine pyrophosphatase LpxH